MNNDNSMFIDHYIDYDELRMQDGCIIDVKALEKEKNDLSEL